MLKSINNFQIIKRFKQWVIDIQLPLWTVPFGLLLLCIVSFAVYIPSLGIYWDDWETILVTRLYPMSEFWKYFSSNRPMAAWTHILLGPVLGGNILNWHLFTFLARWTTILAMFWFLSLLWHQNRKQVIFSVFLFSVYPIFIQQPIAVAYHQHWLAYTLFFLSMGLMIFSIKRPAFYIPSTIFSLTAILLHLAIFEYFVGIELLRPIILWVLFSQEDKSYSKRAIKVIRYWIPYILVLGLFIAWRFFFSVQVENDPNRPVLIFQFFEYPLRTLRHLVEMAFQDSIYVLISAWYKTLQPDLIDLYNQNFLGIWLIVFLSAFVLYLYFTRLHIKDESTHEVSKKWVGQALIVGMIAILLSLLPIWSTDRQAYGDGLNVDRFAMVAMFGASIVIVAILEWLITNPLKKAAILSLLISLSIGMNMRVGVDYQNSWIRQKNLYWQLYWRAPYVLPHTTFLSHGQLFPYVMPTFSFNLLYLEPSQTEETSYWFYLLERQFQQDAGAWLAGKEVSEYYREFIYTASTLNSLVLSNSYGDCLWILGEGDVDVPGLSAIEVQALPLSNHDRIQRQPISTDYPPAEAFGKEPEHGWCYLYEQAALARQFEDWEKVVELGKEAQEKNYSLKKPGSQSPYEWMPFIEGYANQGQWVDALELTYAILDRDKEYISALSRLWHKIADEAPASPGMREALDEVFLRLTVP